MKISKLYWGVLLWWLVGCTVAPPAEDPGETAVPDQSATIQPAETAETPAEEPIVNETPTEPTPSEDSDRQVSEPVTVDLNALTPQPIDGTPIVQPAPGIPGSKSEPVLLAIEDLTRRLNVSADEVDLVSLEEVTWRDSSLGCPEAGMNYLQVLTPGQQLILQVDGVAYHYHSGKGSTFKFCGDPVPPIESMPINPNQPPPPGQDD